MDGVILQLFQGFGISILIFACTLIFALPLGLLVCLGEMSRLKPVSWLFKGLVWIIRGTPLMLQIIIIFYLPGLLGLDMESAFTWLLGEDDIDQKVRTLSVIIAFVINYACYFAEIYRGGIQSIPKGQYEAGQLLGLKKSQTFIRVIFPQVYKRVLAPMSNEIMTLVKDTSLARTIMVMELIFVAEGVMSKTGAIWPLFATGLFYLIFNGMLTLLFSYLEKRQRYYS